MGVCITRKHASIHCGTAAHLSRMPGGLDYFVTGYGTGGTVAGVGRVLRSIDSVMFGYVSMIVQKTRNDS